MQIAGFPGNWRRALIVVSALCVGGCTWAQPKPLPPGKMDAAKSITLHVPPKELVKRLQDQLPAPPLQLTVASVADGTIVTDFKEYEGALHIVRRWRERTRFKIIITPDFNDPTGTSHVEVFDETEEKPSDPQPWYPNPNLKRPERSDEVMKEIEGMRG